MRAIRSWSVLLVVLATTVCIAQSAAGKRYIVMELSLPHGATPQLKVAEGETGSVERPDVGKFGFVPTLQDGGSIVLVDVFDLKQTPRQRLDRVEAVVGGDTVQSNTKPQFGVRVVRVATQ
jgi:hypothetical protein